MSHDHHRHGHEHEHEKAAKKLAELVIDVCIISDSRTEATDETGKMLRERIPATAPFKLGRYDLIKNDAARVVEVVRAFEAGGAHVLIASGGTGVSSRDVTIETLEPMFKKRLTGFGEIFRLLSYEEIGARAMMSRATAGVIGNKVVICLPGSKNAVTLAFEKMIAPQLAHLVYEATR